MPEVKLIYKDEKTKPGFNLGVVLNRKSVKGQVGIEIEVEGNKFPKPPGMESTHTPVKMDGWKYWSYVHDGSLRGEDNAEYVLTVPIDFKEVPAAIAELYTNLEKFGSILDVSNRTSVHVHMNCQEFHMNRLTALMAAWFAAEEVLVEWCGEHRVGNLFCLRAVDAPAIINYLRKFIRTDGALPLDDILHYGGMNPSALHKHGSVEVRTLRGCTDPATVVQWLAIMERLYNLSAEYKDPRDLASMFSSGGPLSFFDFLLGDKAAVVREGTGWSNQQISDAMFRGIRFAQDLCFCRDWDTYKPVKLHDDPFGRDKKKIAAKLMEGELLPQTGSNEMPEAIPMMPPQGFSASSWASFVTSSQQIEAHDPFNTGEF